MRRKLSGFILIVVLISLMLLSSVPVWANGSNINGKGPLKSTTLPSFSYNAIEKWRLGLQFQFEGMATYSDKLNIFTEFSFTSKKFNAGAFYTYPFDKNNVYIYAVSNLEFMGIYDRDSYYERQTFLSSGLVRKDFYAEGYYVADLMVKHLSRRPESSTSYVFEDGKDLIINPSLLGVYKGYVGHLNLVAGIATDYSDYNYIRANALFKKPFDLTVVDRIVVAGEMGYIAGNYPLQQQFFLGGSSRNMFPNFSGKMGGLTNRSAESVYDKPGLVLDGYQDNAFTGDKMYLVQFEYQRNLLSPQLARAMDLPVNVSWRLYTVFGDTWTGDFAEGFKNPKTAIGVGLVTEYLTEYPETYVAINLARGLGEEAAFSLGFEIGTSFQFYKHKPAADRVR